MLEPKKKMYDKAGPRVAAALQKRNMEAYYCPTAAEAVEKVLELIPAGRWGHPYEMGALTAFLCSSGAGYINGVDILADGGQNAGIFVPQI